MEKKDWDWTIEPIGNSGFTFFEMQCIPAFGGGRYTQEETKAAYEYFNKIDNPDVKRTKEECLELINKIKEHIKTT